MRVGVIGCGGMGNKHAKQWSKMPGAELVGVCDVQAELAEKVASSLHTTAYTSYEAMIEREQPDVLSVCLPTFLHKEYVLNIARLGKHIICEKPVAPTLADAKEMIDACSANGVRLFVGHVVRFFSSYMNIMNSVASGAIGKPGVAHAKRVSSHPGQARPWYYNREKSGGVIMDLMIHDIDFMRGLMGEVKSVYALNPGTDEMDYALVTLRFESGAIANLEAFWGYPGAFTTSVEVAGNQGVIRYNSADSAPVKLTKKTPAASAVQTKGVPMPKSPSVHEPHYYELEHFLECIRTGKEPLVTAWDAYKAVEIALAALQSARTGEVVMIGQRREENVYA